MSCYTYCASWPTITCSICQKPSYATPSTQYYSLLSEMQKFYGHPLSGMSFNNAATSVTWLSKCLLLIVRHKTSGQNYLDLRQNSSYVYGIHILIWLGLQQRIDTNQNKTYPTTFIKNLYLKISWTLWVFLGGGGGGGWGGCLTCTESYAQWGCLNATCLICFKHYLKWWRLHLDTLDSPCKQ